MSHFNNHRILLRSEKVRDRNDGRKKCEEFIRNITETILVPKSSIHELIKALFDYESLEIQDSNKKNKPPQTDISTLINKFIRMCYNKEYYNDKIHNTIIRHICNQLASSTLPEAYRNEYKPSLVDIISKDVSLSLTTENYYMLYTTMMQLVIDYRHSSNKNDSIIIKRCFDPIYPDDVRNGEFKLFIVYLYWCQKELHTNLSEDVNTSNDILLSSIAEAFTKIVLQNQTNQFETIYDTLQSTIALFIRYLCRTSQYSTIKTSYIRFLDVYFHFLLRSTYTHHILRHPYIISSQQYVQMLQDHFILDDTIISIVSLLHHQYHITNSYIHIAHDSRLQSMYRVMIYLSILNTTDPVSTAIDRVTIISASSSSSSLFSSSQVINTVKSIDYNEKNVSCSDYPSCSFVLKIIDNIHRLLSTTTHTTASLPHRNRLALEGYLLYIEALNQSFNYGDYLLYPLTTSSSTIYNTYKFNDSLYFTILTCLKSLFQEYGVVILNDLQIRGSLYHAMIAFFDTTNSILHRTSLSSSTSFNSSSSSVYPYSIHMEQVVKKRMIQEWKSILEHLISTSSSHNTLQSSSRTTTATTIACQDSLRYNLIYHIIQPSSCLLSKAEKQEYIKRVCALIFPQLSTIPIKNLYLYKFIALYVKVNINPMLPICMYDNIPVIMIENSAATEEEGDNVIHIDDERMIGTAGLTQSSTKKRHFSATQPMSQYTLTQGGDFNQLYIPSSSEWNSASYKSNNSMSHHHHHHHPCQYSMDGYYRWMTYQFQIKQKESKDPLSMNDLCVHMSDIAEYFHNLFSTYHLSSKSSTPTNPNRVTNIVTNVFAKDNLITVFDILYSQLITSSYTNDDTGSLSHDSFTHDWLPSYGILKNRGAKGGGGGGGGNINNDKWSYYPETKLLTLRFMNDSNNSRSLSSSPSMLPLDEKDLSSGSHPNLSYTFIMNITKDIIVALSNSEQACKLLQGHSSPRTIHRLLLLLLSSHITILSKSLLYSLLQSEESMISLVDQVMNIFEFLLNSFTIDPETQIIWTDWSSFFIVLLLEYLRFQPIIEFCMKLTVSIKPKLEEKKQKFLDTLISHITSLRNICLPEPLFTTVNDLSNKTKKAGSKRGVSFTSNLSQNSDSDDESISNKRHKVTNNSSSTYCTKVSHIDDEDDSDDFMEKETPFTNNYSSQHTASTQNRRIKGCSDDEKNDDWTGHKTDKDQKAYVLELTQSHISCMQSLIHFAISTQLTQSLTQQNTVLHTIWKLFHSIQVPQSSKNKVSHFSSVSRMTTHILWCKSTVLWDILESLSKFVVLIGIETYIETYTKDNYLYYHFLMKVCNNQMNLIHKLSVDNCITHSGDDVTLWESYMKFILNISLGTYQKLPEFLNRYESLRVLQIHCIEGMIRLGEYKKIHFDTLKPRLLDYTHDYSNRVRLHMVTIFPSVFDIYPNYSTVYSSFLEASKASFASDENKGDDDSWKVLSTITMITNIACKSRLLLPRCLETLIELFGLRYHMLTSSSSSLKPAQISSQNASQALTMSHEDSTHTTSLQNRLIDFSSICRYSFHHIVIHYKYSSTQHLITEYLSHLLFSLGIPPCDDYQGLKDTHFMSSTSRPLSTTDVMTDAMCWNIYRFIYEFLVPHSNEVTLYATISTIYQCPSVNSFTYLINHLHSQYHPSHTDSSSLLIFLKKYMYSVLTTKTLYVTLSRVLNPTTESNKKTECDQFIENIDQNIRHFFTISDIQSCVVSNLHHFILQILLSYTYYPTTDCLHPLGYWMDKSTTVDLKSSITTYSMYKSIIVSMDIILNYVKSDEFYNISSLFKYCNILEVLSQLNLRVHDSSLPNTYFSILCILQYIVDYILIDEYFMVNINEVIKLLSVLLHHISTDTILFLPLLLEVWNNTMTKLYSHPCLKKTNTKRKTTTSSSIVDYKEDIYIIQKVLYPLLCTMMLLELCVIHSIREACASTVTNICDVLERSSLYNSILKRCPSFQVISNSMKTSQQTDIDSSPSNIVLTHIKSSIKMIIHIASIINTFTEEAQSSIHPTNTLLFSTYLKFELSTDTYELLVPPDSNDINTPRQYLTVKEVIQYFIQSVQLYVTKKDHMHELFLLYQIHALFQLVKAIDNEEDSKSGNDSFLLITGNKTFYVKYPSGESLQDMLDIDVPSQLIACFMNVLSTYACIDKVDTVIHSDTNNIHVVPYSFQKIEQLAGEDSKLAETEIWSVGGNPLLYWIMSILSSFHIHSAMDLRHDMLPSHSGNLLKKAKGSINSIKNYILQDLITYVWSTENLLLTIAMNTMKDIIYHKLIESMEVTDYSTHLAYSQFAKPTAGYKPMTSISKTCTGLSQVNNTQRSDDSVIHIWDKNLWTTNNKSYTQWICPLVSSLIRYVTKQHTSDSSLTWYKVLYDITVESTSISSLLFPCLIHSFLTYGTEQDQSLLSQYITQYLLSPKCELIEACRLICDTLVFVQNKHIQTFMNPVEISQRRKSIGSKNASIKSSYRLDIDILSICETAISCQYHCTARYFIELYTSLQTAATNALITATSKGTSIPIDSYIMSLSPIPSDAYSTVLMRIYMGIQDYDSVSGVSCNNNLMLQAMRYRHQNNWMKALLTEESILHEYTSTSHNVLSNTMNYNITDSLDGLGYSHVANMYSRHSQSVWNSSIGASMNNNISTFSQLADISLGEGIQAMNKMSVWTLDQDNRSIYPHSHHNISSTNSHNVFNIHEHADHNVNSIVSITDLTRSCSLVNTQKWTSAWQNISGSVLNNFAKLNRNETAMNIVTNIQSCSKLIDLSHRNSFPKLESSVEMMTSSASSLNSPQQSSGCSLVFKRFCSDLNHLPYYLTKNVAARYTEHIDTICGIMKNHSYSQNKDMSQVFALLSNRLLKITNIDSITPSLYKLKAMFMNHLSVSGMNVESYINTASSSKQRSVIPTLHYSSTDLTRLSLTSSWNILESTLLWKQGLKNEATQFLLEQVIRPLEPLLSTTSTNTTKSSSNIKNSSSDSSSSSSSSSNTTIGDETTLVDTLSMAYRLIGEWSIVKKDVTSSIIVTNYFQPAMTITNNIVYKLEAMKSLSSLYFTLYRTTQTYLESKEWEQLETLRLSRKQELVRSQESIDKYKTSLSSSTSSNKNQKLSEEEKKRVTRHIVTLQVEISLDDKARQRLLTGYNTYIIEACKQYLQILNLSIDPELDCMIKFITIWFEHLHHKEIISLVQQHVLNVPTYKFLPLIYQIFSRLGDPVTYTSMISTCMPEHYETSTDCFQGILYLLIRNICIDHPHHSLWLLFSLAYADRIESQSYKQNIDISRCLKAKSIIQDLKSTSNNSIKKLTESTQIVLNAYITFADMNIDKYKNGPLKDIPIESLYNTNQKPFYDCISMCTTVPSMPTCTIPISRDKDYSNIVRIHKFATTFSISETGISRPKIFDAVGSDGVVYKQLLKSGDDTRQDAIMQQVFELVNYILTQDETTRSRRLHIRTYKIIPITPQIGIIEWVNNTIPYGSYLIGGSSSGSNMSAHERYTPTAWKNIQCRDYLHKLSPTEKNQTATPADRRQALETIYNHFPPVFRYFFYENYPIVTEWVSKRLSYTRSVATTSMIGYILGVGDRHSQNILIDTDTAEVIHIDFGIVFDQGKALRIPETVPFRLTNDMIDGLGGTCGLLGTYSSCCKEVLRVLRQNSIYLLTVLSVVIHDPLYNWSLSPYDMNKRQPTVKPSSTSSIISKTTNTTTNTTNSSSKYELQQNDITTTITTTTTTATTTGGQFGKETAERALLKIKLKLQGIEDPSSEGYTVEEHVNYLIQEAKNIDNLCNLFVGWSPWL